MQVVDIQAFLVMFAAIAFNPRFLVQSIQGYFEPIEGNFIMQVVDIQAFLVMFAASQIPGPEYTGVF